MLILNHTPHRLPKMWSTDRLLVLRRPPYPLKPPTVGRLLRPAQTTPLLTTNSPSSALPRIPLSPSIFSNSRVVLAQTNSNDCLT